MSSVQAEAVGGQTPSKKTVVLPGEEIQLGNLAAGTGTFSENGKVYAQILGLKIEYRGTVSVVPLSGVYSARQGDTIIANVIDLGPSNWTLDLRASQPSSMHVNDVPWKVDFGDTARYIDVGQSILCKVLKVDEVKRVFITLNGAGLRKLEGGEIIEIPHTKVGRVVGKGGTRIDKLKKWTSCRIIAGANGRVWIDGEIADIGVAVAAINLIEREADAPNLSELVDAYLKERGREPKPEAQTAAGFGTDDGSKPPAGFEEAGDEKDAEKREKAAKEEE